MHTPSTQEAEPGVPSQLRLHSKTVLVYLEKFLESYLVVTVILLF